MQQHRRHSFGAAGHKYGGAAHAMDGRLLDAIQKQLNGHRAVGQSTTEQRPTALPGEHKQKQSGTEDEWHPAAVGHLHGVGAEERNVDRQKHRRQCHGLPRGPAKSETRDVVKQDRGDEHGARDSDTIRSPEFRRVLERHHDHQAPRRHEPVHFGNVDLSFLDLRRVANFHAGNEPQLDALSGH